MRWTICVSLSANTHSFTFAAGNDWACEKMLLRSVVCSPILVLFTPPARTSLICDVPFSVTSSVIFSVRTCVLWDVVVNYKYTMFKYEDKNNRTIFSGLRVRVQPKNRLSHFHELFYYIMWLLVSHRVNTLHENRARCGKKGRCGLAPRRWPVRLQTNPGVFGVENSNTTIVADSD